MTRLDLEHLSEGQVVTSVDLTRGEAAALNGTKLVTAAPAGDGWKITAAHWVGAVQCGDLKVRVAPKVGAVKVLELLARAYGVRGFRIDAQSIDLADDADLSVVLAVLFEREAQYALALGPQRGYRSEDQSLPVVRGRIRIVDQALRRFGALVPIEVTVDEWTLDTDDNRRLRAATEVLLRLSDVPAVVLAGLRRIDRMLAEARVLPRGSRLAPWRPTRLNARLHRLLHLGDLVLGGGSVEHRAGDVVAHGFALNMAWIFETLVARVLAEQCRELGAASLLPQEIYELADSGALTIRPDLVLSDHSGVIAVADTKYKVVHEDGWFPNADAYQLVTYCLRLGVSVGHLIYAGQELDGPRDYAIEGSDISLRVHTVDLRAAMINVEDQLCEIGQLLAPTL